MKCEDCRYWEVASDESGVCKRNAPSTYPLMPEYTFRHENLLAWWPMTPNDDWCGEFKEKEEENVPSL